MKKRQQNFLEAADECFADPENVDRRTDLVKELSDLVFVCYQFAAAFNLDLDKAMTLVFESNMSKLDEQGKPIFRSDGKVLKDLTTNHPTLRRVFLMYIFGVYDTNGK